ncbi:hypothetical protein TNCT_435491 [Trichonephila clavata]|uniref:Uncharacterized protein n=1 Tax=Trichonephila clavata TaxID=2740835 RepID=A0A8X6HCU9_TRICU|nr:hypothetical protein TNCT_435491 [Trichonephila clavata]
MLEIRHTTRVGKRNMPFGATPFPEMSSNFSNQSTAKIISYLNSSHSDFTTKSEIGGFHSAMLRLSSLLSPGSTTSHCGGKLRLRTLTPLKKRFELSVVEYPCCDFVHHTNNRIYNML